MIILFLGTTARHLKDVLVSTSFPPILINSFSLSLVDFLADGTKLDKRSNKGKFIYLLAFVPPMLVVIFDPNVFIKALSYAGILCVLLLIILPLLMIIGGRYWKHYSHEYNGRIVQ